MSSRVDVSIVIPTYNERENIARLIKVLHDLMVENGFSYEIVVVDDNSPDGTADAVRAAQNHYNVKLIVRPGKMGLASAVLEGFRAARGSLLAVMDADFQHPPEALPEMLKKALGECDVVVGSRYVRGGSTRGWSPPRKIISRGADLIAKVLLPKTRKIKDTMSGYFVLRREVIDGVSLDPRGFKILLEVLVKGRYRKACEHPIEFRARVWGKSKLGTTEIFNYLLHVLNLAHESIRFVLVGGLGTIVNLTALYLLGYLLGVEHWVAVPLAFEVSTLFNFVMHEVWTFKSAFSRGVIKRLAEFHGATVVHFVSQVTVSNALFYGYGVERVVSQLISIVVGFFLNYVLSRYIVWRKALVRF
ncbi:MAG: glycosyltransferase family 2 protein [Sulfolobales archaeon]|nr:glycosyltransferase family 2 protein [Sulfolobales archaeon]MCX8208041.1 glycosyltransferase family 2 protein [Sulfolobales archaeon]MDW8010216.1 glycosyltransferase family 2 protein [Sulfolobales archaeon]